ncbi:MAG: hypothetical protein HC772_14270, partial [Leptolyngbyaceae cyanobacterium CRU_2_3]|nr:hypothetical protein [Leptolyngbyaceae cyanobacterium CRU_2_3]
LVAIAQGLYVAIVEKQRGQWRWSSIARSYGVATAGGLLAFLPWLVLLLNALDQVNEATIATTRKYPLSYLLDQWFLNINRVFINGELHSFNVLVVVLTIVALYWLCRTTPKRTWLLVLSLIAVPFLALALPDLVGGGERSLRIRYLIPSYLGIQIAFAYLLATPITAAKAGGLKAGGLKAGGLKAGRIVLVLLLASGIFACGVNTQTQIGWTKSIRKSGYYPVAASFVNRADRPLVISDQTEVDILSFSYELKPDVQFQLVTNPRRLKVAEGFGSTFLLNPSQRLRNILEKRNYKLLLLCQDEDENPGAPQDRLWLVR